MARTPTREQVILDELLSLRRERIRLDRRIRELTMLDRMERGLSPFAPPKSGDPNSDLIPCHCLRCDYAWYPSDPSRAPVCCARCGTTQWMLPPTDTSRRPGDQPALSWARRKDPRDRLAARAKRLEAAKKREVKEKEKEAATATPTPPPPREPEYAWDRPLVLPPREAPAPTVMDGTKLSAFPPPPDIRATLPPPPDPSTVSLSARLREYRAQDPSPEQPERMVSAGPMVRTSGGELRPRDEVNFTNIQSPEASDAEGETSHVRAGERDPTTHSDDGRESPAGDASEGADRQLVPAQDPPPRDVPPAPAEEVIAEYVPREQVGSPQSDAEREELEKARSEAWPTTRSED